jgi:hypothetical protein
MPRTRLYPHQTADLNCVTFGDWWIERNGVRDVLPDSLQGWDYASEEVIGTSVSIDEKVLLASTGMSSLDDLELLLVADCAAAQRRVVARNSLTGYGIVKDAAFELPLPSGVLASSVRLTTHLVLARDLSETPPRVASVRGARLISSKPRTLVLEGEASRFPTEPVAFSDIGLPDSPWTLHMNFEDLNASFMGAVRLLVNTENRIGRMLLESSTASSISPIAMADILRLLVATVGNHRDDVTSGDFEEGSIGEVVDSMCNFFLRQGLAASTELYQREPVHFELLLHERMKPFDKVFA